MSRLPYFSGVLTALLPTFAACDTEPTPAGTLHTDSAGVPVATAVTPLWDPGEGWTVADRPEVEIGSVDGLPEYQFADVVAAVRLDNSDIVVADRGASELRSYDSDGNFQWRVGREGEGPGEFLRLDFLGRMAGDSLVAYDGRLLRVQVFDPAGGVVRTLPALAPELATTAGSAPDKAVGVLDGRLIVRFIDLGVGTPSGIVRWPNERLVALDLASGAATSLLLVPGPEATVEWRAEDHYTHGSYVFGKGPEYGAAAGRLALIDTESHAVRIVSPADGSLMGIVQRDVQPIEATEEVFQSLLDGVVGHVFGNPDEAPSEQVDLLTRMWTDRPRAPYLPVLRSVHVDATGSLWVTPHYLAGADPPPFEVFAADGVWLGRVSLPPGLDRGFIQYGAPELEIGTDYVLGVWTDELDVQYVRMYRLDR